MNKHRPNFLFIIGLCSSAMLLLARCQNVASLSQDVAAFYDHSFSNLTSILTEEMSSRAAFCIADPRTDFNMAFNYSSNLKFLATCMEKQGDVSLRLCTEAEIKFYLNNVFEKAGPGSSSSLIPNRNCNLSTWISGCEPGWACRTDSTVEDDLLHSKEIPLRTVSCQACCEGFFCPHGLTCMMPCPLGAYCPLAKSNSTTGLCEPYLYQLPIGHPNHTCGGANIWADIGSSQEIFCSEGYYCPTTIDKEQCGSGHYCRRGSTSERRCSKLIQCKSNTANQNIHAYGIMLIIALVALLLIIYSCSDQILAIRDRRQAKSRERAARSVQESEHARAKWRAARDAVKKHIHGLQANLSHKFSPKKHQDELRILDRADLEDENFLSPLHPSKSGASQFSSVELDRRLNESSNQTTRLHALTDESESYQGSTFEIQDISTRKRKAQKEKKMSNDTQIFKYAYAQIEKEKSQEQKNGNLTFSQVISMATSSHIKKRPLIEVAFKDLTITLKGRQKCLLKCLNGKIMPGHIAAIMGPSGAGKTTFLSALAGKATACTRSGLVLINGKPEPIHSYRKIIGFVPQDDIVHGNLTVQENLWFSARCRLSSDFQEVDKVLILERVIENLGLQEVRDSLVGTVEKRGISGGQRKRVNVGLEMVMEPSLLFLDEPTSGLDSSSSRLLLQALRHEAHAGVNICMVVHQPSYALFQMFDDLILLAKGGLMVYLGSVRKVEEYFGGLGIYVPEHINPPDYYIDILEGLVEPRTSSVVNYKELPLRWMLHNGYPIPEDMQSSATRLAVSVSGRIDSTDNVCDEQTFALELWQDVRHNVEVRRDHIYHNLLRWNDLSGRRTPSIIVQYKYFLGRTSKQWLREARLQATDYLILLIAGACLGSITKISDANFGASGYSYTIIAVSLLCQIAALRSFSLDKLQYWRESASGMSSLAHFMAKDTIDHFNTLIKPAVYLSMFYFFTNPRSTFFDNYVVLVCLVYCVTGMGYAFAIFLDPGPAQLFSVLLPVCLTLIATQALNNHSLMSIANLCYPKWALEAFVIANAKRYYGVWLITRCAALYELGFSLHAWGLCIFIIIMTGVFSRIVAFIGMLTLPKK
ncbi:hypothetical protein Nepgr_001258 [Nepenthes gracilis]|uniref:ABC transporter domain-containing protein n=1 Tax=Nepenthes gracilis TaxID=150966 RepID=A0AAD3RWU7_NEPGR|nr:hypothetical protein Nepgr_001258 [Nepenthes gracilis]